MANYFKYNEDKFRETIKAYEDSIKEFKDLQSNTKKSIEDLKSKGWNSQAGKTFFENYTDDWSPILDNYMDLLNYLKDCLKAGISEFNPLVEEAEKLRIE